MKTTEFKSSRVRQQRLGKVAVIIAVLVLAAFGIRFFLVDQGDDSTSGLIAKVEQAEGKLLIKRGPKTVEYQPELPVMAGDTYQTLGEARVMIRYLDDGTKVVLGKNTTLIFNANNGGKTTNLAGGIVEFEIPPQKPDEPMRLVSYNSEALVSASAKAHLIQQYHGLTTHFKVIKGALSIRRFADGNVKKIASGETYSCQPADVGVIAFDPNRVE